MREYKYPPATAVYIIWNKFKCVVSRSVATTTREHSYMSGRILVPIAFRQGNYSTIIGNVTEDPNDADHLELISYAEFKRRSNFSEHVTFKDEETVLVAMCYFDTNLLDKKCETQLHYNIGYYYSRDSLSVGFSETDKKASTTLYLSTARVFATDLNTKCGSSITKAEAQELCKSEVTHVTLTGLYVRSGERLDNWCDISKIESLYMRDCSDNKRITTHNLDYLGVMFEGVSSRLGRDCFSSLRMLQGTERSIVLFFHYFDVDFLETLKIEGLSSTRRVNGIQVPKLDIDTLVTDYSNRVSADRVGKVIETLPYSLGHHCDSDDVTEFELHDFTHFTKTKGATINGYYRTSTYVYGGGMSEGSIRVNTRKVKVELKFVVTSSAKSGYK